MPIEVSRQPLHPSNYTLQPGAYPHGPYPPPQLSQYPPVHAYPGYPAPGPSHTLPPPIRLTHAHSVGSKRLAPPHPAESPAKKKQSKWTPDEDASIIELRGSGMKWEDISKHLPGRSAISCRLRFQNYLERRAEWDEERKNKLARLYERFKKDMWEKIAKEMQLPWRAAENMHWQIGEVEMAQRANVPVFHTAGQSSASGGGISDRTPSTSPPASTGPGSGGGGARPGPAYTHTHNHSLPQIPLTQTQSTSPIETRGRRNSAGPSPNGHPSTLRRGRADSARSVPTISSVSASTANPTRPLLPPVGELAGPHLPAVVRYPLPPVVSSGERR